MKNNKELLFKYDEPQIMLSRFAVNPNWTEDDNKDLSSNYDIELGIAEPEINKSKLSKYNMRVAISLKLSNRDKEKSQKENALSSPFQIEEVISTNIYWSAKEGVEDIPSEIINDVLEILLSWLRVRLADFTRNRIFDQELVPIFNIDVRDSDTE
jgi:hypothetical protein